MCLQVPLYSHFKAQTVQRRALHHFFCASGWLYTTDRFWGVEWVEDLHDGLTNVLIGLVIIHVAGVIWTSLRGRENLVAAMFHGRKRRPGPEDVD